MYQTKFFSTPEQIDEWFNGIGKPFEVVGYTAFAYENDDKSITLITVKI